MKPRAYPPYEDDAGLKFPGLAIGLAGVALAALAVFFIRSGGRLAALVTSLLLAACATPVPAVPPLGQTSFDAYRFETSAWLQQHRQFQTDNRADELSWNSPGEWRPQGVAEKGVLLLHGLGDSPWSFVDIAKQLAEQGFLVRTVLLPGHGTRPADMMGVSVDDWHRVVDEQMAILAKDVPQVMVGGFSTGANLALEYALDHDAVSGLLLFSPAFKSRAAGIDWVLPWLAPVKPWLRQPVDGQAQQTPLRYTNVPTNGFAQYYRSSASVRAKLEKRASTNRRCWWWRSTTRWSTCLMRSRFSRRVSPIPRAGWSGTAPCPKGGQPHRGCWCAAMRFRPNASASSRTWVCCFRRAMRCMAARAASPCAGTARTKPTTRSAWPAPRSGMRNGATRSPPRSTRA
jgi:esterase/lipase